MITHVHDDNILLFDKASVKLGLLPIEKQELENDEYVTKRYKRVYNGETEKWELKLCKEYDKTEGADNSEADFDENGNFLIVKRIDGQDQKVPSNGITSLNEYFQHITELADLALNKGRTGTDPYFLRLPLDEPFFEINANTRGITVPGELSQIAVKGDKLAEIVFFRIDRYFDAIDLDTRHIYIEWEAPDGNGGVRKGISRDFLRDSQSQKKDNKLIFGWVIGDELTKFPGTIRFAVRFVEWIDREDTSNSGAEGETGLVYSFSSLPATITVSDTLNYTLFENDEELEFITKNSETNISNLRSYLEDSFPDSMDESTTEEADKAIFYRDLDTIEGIVIPQIADHYVAEERNENDEVVRPAYYIHNLNNSGWDSTNGEDKNGTLPLVAAAYSPDGGNISYRCYYRENFGESSSNLSDRVNPLYYIETIFGPDDTPKANVKYYTLDSETQTYTMAEEIVKDGETKYYEKGILATINHPGLYFVEATNRVGGLRQSHSSSSILCVPTAQPPKVVTKMYHDAEHMDEPQQFVINNISSSLRVDPDINQTIYVDGKPRSNIVIDQPSAEDALLIPSSIALQPTFTIQDLDNVASNLTYQWYKADNKEMNNATPILNATGATYTATAPGFYGVEVTNHFNNSTATLDVTQGGVCRVTNMPTIPTINWNEFENTLIGGQNGRQMPEIIVSEVEHDKMTYEWHKIVVSQDSSVEGAGALEEQDPVALNDFPAEFPATGVLDFREVNGQRIAKIPFAPLRQGRYYFILANELNGAIIHMNSANKYGIIDVVVNDDDNNGN